MVRIVALFGGTAVAGYTIAVRVIVFVLLPAWGVGNAAATLVGQNLGAGDAPRAERAVWITAFTNMAFLGSVAVGFILFPALLVSPFSSDPDVIRVAADCLRIVSFSYVFWALGMVTVMAFNGAGDTTTPTWINLIVFWVLQIPLAYWLAVVLELGPRGVFSAIAISQAALAVVGVAVFRLGHWKTRAIYRLKPVKEGFAMLLPIFSGNNLRRYRENELPASRWSAVVVVGFSRFETETFADCTSCQ